MTDRGAFESRIERDPTNADLRLEYCRHLLSSREYMVCLEQVHQAIDLSPSAGTMDALEKLEHKLIYEHTVALAGPSAPLVVKEQPLRVENGRLVEVVLGVSRGDQPYLISALESPWLDKLEYLGLIIDDVGSDVLGIIASSSLPALSDLSVWTRGRLSEQAVFAFAASKVAAQLEALYLRGARLTDNMVEALTARLTRLQELRLRSEDIGGITEKASFCIADSPLAPRLTRLGLIGTSVGEQGALALATSSKLLRLEVLELRDGILTNAGARILAASSGLRRLRRLDVSRNNIDELGLLQLRGMGIDVRDDDQHPVRVRA